MKNESKLTTAQYKFCCELIWGGVPIDRTLAEESALFKQRAPEILNEYPMLDKSFFEKHSKTKSHEIIKDENIRNAKDRQEHKAVDN